MLVVVRIWGQIFVSDRSCCAANEKASCLARTIVLKKMHNVSLYGVSQPDEAITGGKLPGRLISLLDGVDVYFTKCLLARNF